VYLVRAHAELGALDDAAQALATIENGPAARDPSALGLLIQARLTLLAFAGRLVDVERLLAGDTRLFITKRAQEFFTATAAQHEMLAISPGLSRFLDGVAERTAQAGRPLVLRKRRAPVTLSLILANVAVALLGGYFFSNDPPATALIRDGALFRPAVEAGEWWRAFSAMFMHGGPWHLGLNMFAVFVLGRFCEELFGPLRYFVIYTAAGLAGAVGSTVNHRQVGLTVGASGAIMGLLGAIIVVLILRRGTWPEAWRRALLWNLSTLGALQIYIGFQLPMVDNAAHVGGLLGGGAMALLIAEGGLLGRAGRVITSLFALACVCGVLWTGVSIWRTPLSKTMSRLPTKIVSVAGKKLVVPSYWEEDPAHDVVRDPYLGVQIGRATERNDATPIDDPALSRLIDSIAKPAQVP
jgi:membrane associated rhomboid family serine protease